MTLLPTFLAGTNFVMHSAGWLEGGLVSCYEKFIVDIELLRMLRHEFTPLEIDEASLAFGAHQEVGAGRALPRRGAHARALPRVLLPAAAVVDRELRPLDAQRRQGRGRAGGRDLARDARRVRGAADRRRRARAAAGVRRAAARRAGRLTGDLRARVRAAARPHRHAAARAGDGAARGRADARAGDRPHAAARGGQAARAREPRGRPAAHRHVRDERRRRRHRPHLRGARRARGPGGRARRPPDRRRAARARRGAARAGPRRSTGRPTPTR